MARIGGADAGEKAVAAAIQEMRMWGVPMQDAAEAIGRQEMLVMTLGMTEVNLGALVAQWGLCRGHKKLRRRRRPRPWT
jgi:hypothetical protein